MTAQARSRLVVFRCALRQACENRGGRNVSEFTRSEVLEYLNSDQLSDSAHVRYAALEQEIAGIKAAVTHLSRCLES